MKKSLGTKTFAICNYIILSLLAVVTLYPFMYVVFASFSEPGKLLVHEGLLYKPAGFSLASYVSVFKYPNIYTGYANTIFYVVVGTSVNILATLMAAYVLSRKQLMLRRFLTLMFIFTMYFNGGMIPTFLLMQDLHLINNRMAIILPSLVTTYNLLIMINSLDSIPASLEDAARIDGASHWHVLFKIIIPLAKPTIMVIMMYYAVAHWNSWYSAMLYLQDVDKMPVQVFLRKILIENNRNEFAGQSTLDVGTTLQYAIIVVTTLPILMIYPLIQKHFVSGVMIGAVKE